MMGEKGETECRFISLKTCLCPLFFTIFKRHVFLRHFERSTLKRNLTYSCFFFPLFHEHLFSPGLPRATRLLETCLEKITVCVIETMFVTLPLVQMNEEKGSEPKKPSTNQGKYRERSSNFCYTLNPCEHTPLNIKSNEIFFKKYL